CVAIILFPASLLVFIGRTFEYDNRDPGMTATFGGAILLIGQLPFRIVLYYLIAFGQWIESRGRIHAS
ncbi:MAG: hypothetical protein JJU11_15985, partial [Candidatus Sumerlaeia bacterium]|nr:hypothetical protein [Candidatus Sumerlaeia bacterium]